MKYLLVLICQYNFGKIHIYSKLINHSYRMEQAMSTKMLKNINLTKNQTMIYKKIYYAVEMHRKAMKLVCSK